MTVRKLQGDVRDWRFLCGGMRPLFLTQKHSHGSPLHRERRSQGCSSTECESGGQGGELVSEGIYLRLERQKKPRLFGLDSKNGS